MGEHLPVQLRVKAEARPHMTEEELQGRDQGVTSAGIQEPAAPPPSAVLTPSGEESAS